MCSGVSAVSIALVENLRRDGEIRDRVALRVVDITECSGGACNIGGPGNQLRFDAEVVASVVSATVTGIGPYKLINGARATSSSTFGRARSTTTEALIGSAFASAGTRIDRRRLRRPPTATAPFRPVRTAVSRTPGTGTTLASHRSRTTTAERVSSGRNRGECSAGSLPPPNPRCSRARGVVPRDWLRLGGARRERG